MTLETPETPELIEILNRNENNIPPELIEALSGKGNIDHKYSAFTPEIINNFENKDRLYMALFYLKKAALYRNRARKNKTNNPKIYIFDSGEFVNRTLGVLNLKGIGIRYAINIYDAGINISEYTINGLKKAQDQLRSTGNKNKRKNDALELLIKIEEQYSSFKKV